ncbi:MAG: hypothetical protein ACKPHU_23920, partial [Planctomycetaceae bacterium]
GRGRRVVLLLTPRPAVVRAELQRLAVTGQPGSSGAGITVMSAETSELLRYCLPPQLSEDMLAAGATS